MEKEKEKEGRKEGNREMGGGDVAPPNEFLRSLVGRTHYYDNAKSHAASRECVNQDGKFTPRKIFLTREHFCRYLFRDDVERRDEELVTDQCERVEHVDDPDDV